MKKRNDRRHSTHLRSLALIGAFILAVAVLAVPFYTVKSSSLETRVPSQPSGDFRTPANIGKTSPTVSNPAILAPLSAIFMPLMPVPQAAPEGIATYDSTCATPQSDFFIGDVVCAKATGVPTTLFPWKVLWVDPAGFVRQSNDASP